MSARKHYVQENADIEKYLQYFYDIPAECPYGMSQTAVYRQQQFGGIPESVLGSFLEAGFRRNGNTLYTMNCPECRKCTPIRVVPTEFQPNRNQKRVWKRNNDIVATMGPLTITEEKLVLCGEFLTDRFPGRGNSPVDYYGSFFASTIANTLEIEYRLQGRLIGVGIIDIGESWVNAVYFYFDPSEARRSPGTYNILYLIELCRKHDLQYLNLGYVIHDLQAMEYKANFKPHYLLIDGEWVKEIRS
jgi:leucyl-tRNA---protein transferase